MECMFIYLYFVPQLCNFLMLIVYESLKHLHVHVYDRTFSPVSIKVWGTKVTAKLVLQYHFYQPGSGVRDECTRLILRLVYVPTSVCVSVCPQLSRITCAS